MMEYSTVSIGEETQSDMYAGLNNSERDSLLLFLNEAYSGMTTFVSESSEEKMNLMKESLEETRKTISLTITKIAH